MQPNLIIIKTRDELEELKSYLKDKDYVAFDTETTGVEKSSEIIGFSISAELECAYYVILKYWDVETQQLKTLDTFFGINDFLSTLRNHRIVGHNINFDIAMVQNNFEVDLMPSVEHDTMIMAHLIDENRRVGLKELAATIFGEDAKDEQIAMRASISKNGGVLTKEKYELYKGDADLIARYGAQDALLTLKLFFHLIPQLYDEGLDEFYFTESMPLMKGPTYQLNNTGLAVNVKGLNDLKLSLEAEIVEAHGFMYEHITPYVKDKYPGTKATNIFNIGAGQQLSWLLFEKLGNTFYRLTDEGRDLCHYLDIPLPYSFKAKVNFIDTVKKAKNVVWVPKKWIKKGDILWYNPKTKRLTKRPKKVGDYWKYLACGKETLNHFSDKYKWVAKYLEYAKNKKLLSTYVLGIQERMKYGIIRPSFLQHGTMTGRYSSKLPNFQNLPRDDKRVKSCIVARPGKVFVGADYSQLEPRVFASFSQDERLMKCFSTGDDFYSVVGAEVFQKYDCSMKKDDANSFAKKYPELRQIAKVIALSAPYGTTAPKMTSEFEKWKIKKDINESQEIIDIYFDTYPQVKKLQLESHDMAKTNGKVFNMFGRARRLPGALNISKIYGKSKSENLPADVRTQLNQAINFRIQSSGASIVNRASIKFYDTCKEHGIDAKIVLQVHDEIVVECSPEDSELVAAILKESMETAVELPGVLLSADPKIGNNLAELK